MSWRHALLARFKTFVVVILMGLFVVAYPLTLLCAWTAWAWRRAEAWALDEDEDRS